MDGNDDQLRQQLDECLKRLTALGAIEDDLRQSKAHLDMIVDSAQDFAIFSLDTDNRITMWSTGAERIFGWSAEEAIGQGGDLIFTAEQREQGVVDRELAIALAEGNALDERWHQRKDGSLLFASGMMRPMHDNAGTLRGFVKVARDYTQQKLLEQERAELLRQTEIARARAERAEDQRRRFTAMVIHELRTPLTSIKGFTSTLLAPDVTWDADQQREFIGVIEEEAERLTEMVSQLLEVSQVEAGTLRIQAVTTEISRIVMTVQAQLQTLSKAHTLMLSVPDDIPSVIADPVRIAQVIANLVGNAAKFAPTGTRIDVAFTHDEKVVTVRVADQGPGIAEEQRERVFEAYHQLEGGARGRGGGIGLGLAICKGIIDAHGGRIWIEAGTGSGTTVAFTLPIADQH